MELHNTVSVLVEINDRVEEFYVMKTESAEETFSLIYGEIMCVALNGRVEVEMDRKGTDIVVHAGNMNRYIKLARKEED